PRPQRRILDRSVRTCWHATGDSRAPAPGDADCCSRTEGAVREKRRHLDAVADRRNQQVHQVGVRTVDQGHPRCRDTARLNAGSSTIGALFSRLVETRPTGRPQGSSVATITANLRRGGAPKTESDEDAGPRSSLGCKKSLPRLSRRFAPPGGLPLSAMSALS